MKKLIISSVMALALMVSTSVMAQDTSKATCTKGEKKECTKGEKKECTKGDKKSCSASKEAKK